MFPIARFVAMKGSRPAFVVFLGTRLMPGGDQSGWDPHRWLAISIPRPIFSNGDRAIDAWQFASLSGNHSRLQPPVCPTHCTNIATMCPTTDQETTFNLAAGFSHSEHGQDDGTICGFGTPLAACTSGDTHQTIESNLKPSEFAGQVIDRFRLEKPIGEGGMGTVWLAEQFRPVIRKVAVKILNNEQINSGVLKRFRDEQQILASLNHPGIARILDAGTTQTGNPFLVMELAEGVPIDEFCNTNRLTLQQRIRLVADVAEVLGHAHENLVVHRDLKPSNLLISGTPQNPVIKLIDFGISKTLDGQGLKTVDGHLLGTPHYMSPEQAALSHSQIDGRSDIYSLGVILYELVTGQLPLASRADGTTASVQQVLQSVVSEEPLRPSSTLKKSGRLTELAKQRATSRKYLLRQTRADLDWLCLKALEKKPEDRYESVSQFSEDLHRLLNFQPIFARRPTLQYRLSKWLRRRAVVFSLSSALVITLLIALGGILLNQHVQSRNLALQVQKATEDIQSLVSSAERKEQELENFRSNGFFVTEEELEFLTIGWEQVKKQLAQVGDLQKRFPEIREFDDRVSNIQASVARFSDSRQTLKDLRSGIELAMDFDPESLGSTSRKGLTQLADSLNLTINRFQTPSRGKSALFPAFRFELIEAIHFLISETRPEGVTHLWTDAPDSLKQIRGYIRFLDRYDPDPWRCQVRRAALLLDREELESLELHLPIEHRSQPPFAQLLYAESLARSGNPRLGMRTLERAQREFSNHVWLTQYLGRSYLYMDEIQDFHRAARYLTAAVSLAPYQSRSCQSLAEALYQSGDLEAAVESCQRALEFHPRFHQARSFLASTFIRQGKYERAIEELDRILMVQPDDVATLGSKGVATHQLGRNKEAGELFQKAYQLNGNDPTTISNLSRFYQSIQRSDRAVTLLLNGVKKLPGELDLKNELGMLLVRMNRPNEAIPHLKSICQEKKDAESHYHLGLAFHYAKKYPEAIKAYDVALKINPEHQLSRQGRSSALQWLKAGN